MCKKFLIFPLLILCVVAQGEVVNRYSFTDGDTAAIDSISGRDGTLTGTAAISGNQLVLDGDGAVELPADILDADLESVTIEAWFEISADVSWQALFDFGGTENGGGGNCICFTPTSGDNTARFYISTNGYPSWQTGEERTNAPEIALDTPTHVACVYDGISSEMRLYVDGVLEDTTSITMELSDVARMFAYIGDSLYTADPYFQGTIDEFRIYDTALTDDEVSSSFDAGPDATIGIHAAAVKPSPENKEEDVRRNVILSWRPGDYPGTHNVYFSMDFNDVNDSTALMNENQDANTYDPGLLEYGTTYYWRIDEVNDSADATVHRGVIWSFTTEAYSLKLPNANITVSASSNESEEEPINTINESGLDPNHMDLHSDETMDMWSTDDANAAEPAWIRYDFDKVYKLHQMLVWNYNGQSLLSGFGIKDVNIEYSEDGQSWTQLTSTTQFARGTGKPGYKYNTTVDFNGISAKSVRINALTKWGGVMFPQYGLSEVRFMYVPVRAREPYPDDMNDVPIDVTLSWRPGHEAIQHVISLSTDIQEVESSSAVVDTINETSYGPLALSLGTTYYWRIDEAGDSETWTGDLWSFNTQDYVVVEDFEFYTDVDPDRVWDFWADGWDDNSNGSTMGYPDPDFDAGEHFVETNIVHSGEQSAPIFYNNSGTTTKSEVSINTADLPIGTDWTPGSPVTLVMWFYGDPNNTPADMYVKLNGKKVAYKGDSSNLTKPRWNPLSIDLSEFGVNIGSITSLAIGFDRTVTPAVESMVFVDDIRLYREAPAVASPNDPGTENLVHSYTFEDGTANDSVGTAHGTLEGDATITDGSLVLDGTDDWMTMPGDVIALNTFEELTLEIWYTPTAGANTGFTMLASFGAQRSGWMGVDYLFMSTAREDDVSRAAISIGNYSEPWSIENGVNGTEYDDGNLHHMAVTVNATELAFYIDGLLAGTAELTGANSISGISQELAYLGKAPYSDPEWAGKIHEFNIYNRALTDGEVLFLADQGQ